MLRPSPNHGTQRLPNDDDDELRHRDWGKRRFPSVVGAAILETVHPYLVLDESLTFALPDGPLSFLISSVVSAYCRLNRRPSKT